MRGKVLITISDLNGSKQYTILGLLKHFYKWVLALLFIILILDIVIFKAFATSFNNDSTIECKEVKHKVEMVDHEK